MRTLIVADANIPFIESMYSDIAEVRLAGGHKITPSTVRDADILLVRSVTKIGKDLLEKSKVRFVGTATSGYDHVDLNYLSSKGIRFAYAPGCNSNSVAEYIVAAVLVLGRRFNLDLSQTTLGVVGVGNVGSKVVRKASALGMQVLQNDPPLERSGNGRHFLPLDQLMKAEIVSLHVPLTYDGIDTTHHLFDEKRIAVMKPGSILINTSRGPVVKTGAIRDALQKRHLRTAVLDVWENEPEIEEEILKKIALGTPHIAGYSIEGKTNGAKIIYNEVCRYLKVKQTWSDEGKLPLPEVTKIELPDPGEGNLETVREAVERCYDIERDDAGMRKIIGMDPDQRKGYFIKLRAEYPARREFAATDIEVSQSEPVLVQCLTDIGFTVNGKRSYRYTS